MKYNTLKYNKIMRGGVELSADYSNYCKGFLSLESEA